MMCFQMFRLVSRNLKLDQKSTLMIVNALNLKILLNGIYVMEIRFFFGTDKDSDPLNVLCCG